MLFILAIPLGLSIGSFLNVVIYRLHAGQSILKGRSFCPECRHQLGVLDLIPVLSFIFLKGRCRYCKKKISWQYPLVESATAMLFCLAYLKYFDVYGFLLAIHGSFFGALGHLFFDWFFISIFIVIFVYDFKYYLISDTIVLPAAALAFLTNGFFLKVSFLNLLLAGGAGGGFFLLQYLLSRGKWIGDGDIRLGLLIGFLAGWPLVLVALFLAYAMGGLAGSFLIIIGKKKWTSELPFGAFLSLAAVLVMLYGENIWRWYLALLGL